MRTGAGTTLEAREHSPRNIVEAEVVRLDDMQVST